MLLETVPDVTMWKCLVILVIVQRAILSQPVSHENKRDTRNLNFEECCPCPSSDRSSKREQDSWDDQVPRDCPCKTESDSDTAASVFRPVMRAVEPFMRSVEKPSEPKPLLRPEVGLASSVLETLREVTDQGYQEALARDAARSAIDASELNIKDQKSPRNIVNIILNQKHDHIDDVMPEASHVQEARYIQPPLAKTSGNNENRLQLFRNTLLPLSKMPSKGLTHNKIFDMDNSASNLQEQTLQPLRSNLFDDFKLKSDLLKSKLFPIGNSLGIVRSHLDTETIKNRNIKLPSLLDHIKIPKENDLRTISSNIKNIDKHSQPDVILSSSSNAEKYTNIHSNNFRNSPESSFLKMNNNLDSKRNNLNIKTSNKIKNMSTQRESTLLYNNDRSDIDVAEISDNNNCNVYNGIENNGVTNDNHVLTLDTAPSPSEVLEVQTPSAANDVLQINENEDCDIVDEENIDGETNSLGDNFQHTNVDEVIPSYNNELLCEESPDLVQLNSMNTGTKTVNNNAKDENLCDINDFDASASSYIPQTTNLHEISDTKVRLNNVNEAKRIDNLNLYKQRSVDENTLTTTAQTIKVDDNHKVNALPNMKKNILKTLENFKKTNEQIQEKLKANVQDALQSLVKKNSVVEIESSPNTVDSKKADDDNKKNNIQTMDLQEMSNRILNLSNIKENEKLRYTLQSRENQENDFKYDNNDEQSNDNYVRVSELDDASELLNDISSSENLKSSGILNSAYNDHKLKEIQPKILDDPCVKSPTNSKLIESNIKLDQNEMISEASSPVVSSTHHVVQPNNFNVKNVLDNFKTSVTDFFNNQRESMLLPSVRDSENENTLINAIYEKNAQTSENYLPRTNNHQRLELRPKVKNSYSNLNSYKAKIAVPVSLNRESYRDNTENSSPFNTLRSQIDTLNPFHQKRLGKDNVDKYNVGSKSEIFNTLRKTPQSTDDYQFKPHNVLKNIQDAFDLPLTKPVFRNEKKLLSKTSPSDIFGTITKTNNDLNEKFRAFQLELNDKISSFSQKIADARHMQVKSEPRFKNIKTISNLKHTKLPNVKDKDMGRTSLLTVKKSPLKLNIPQSSSKLVQKLKNPTQVTLDSKTSPSIAYATKLTDESAKRKGIKLKSLKENKVTIMFTTIRPNLTLKRKYPLNSQNSNPEIKSGLKSSEPRSSASERIVSRVPLSNRPSPKEEEMSNYDELASKYKFHDRTNTNSNSEGTNRRKAANSVVSKIREAVKVKANGGSRKIDDNNMLRSDPGEVLSSSNLNPVALKDRSLKENVPYKCKMMCFEDHSDV